MVVAGIVVTGMTFGSAGVIGAGMVSAGIGMMAGGIYQMLSPQPKGLQGRDDPDNKPSYAFGGSVNTLAMGNPVALYMVSAIGGAIISAGIVAKTSENSFLNIKHPIGCFFMDAIWQSLVQRVAARSSTHL
jgi:predicted phage tail protein